MTKAIRIDQNGGPEQLKLVDVTVGDPGPGEVRIRHHAVGLNFIDVYQRSGLYQLPIPLTLGMEGAGVVDCMVAMPGQLFYSTQIPACLWILAKGRSNGLVKKTVLS